MRLGVVRRFFFRQKPFRFREREFGRLFLIAADKRFNKRRSSSVRFNFLRNVERQNRFDLRIVGVEIDRVSGVDKERKRLRRFEFRFRARGVALGDFGSGQRAFPIFKLVDEHPVRTDAKSRETDA